MNSNLHIEVKNLAKQYSNNSSFLSYLFNKSKDITGRKVLSDINFTVRRGEAFGIIGRNGAGKSTLLQIITGTLKQTSGTCTVTGRISALLELGSGFNPDFTGRENIYLAGSILGITKIEMDNKIPEIVAFADIGEFLEQPVRTYSTGMVMRVAFAVAVAVEPDILIIDEALSVGDILFQQKCNTRLKELLNKGVTLLVVTHDTSFVVNMCTRAMWLDSGKIRFLGNSGDCVKEYVAYMTASSSPRAQPQTTLNIFDKLQLPNFEPLNLINCNSLGDATVFVDKVWILNTQRSDVTSLFQVGEWCEILVVIKAKCDVTLVSAGCELTDRHGQVIFATGLRVINQLIPSIFKDETRTVSIRFKLDIKPGQYTLDVGCGALVQGNNTWHRILAVSILELSQDDSCEEVHGIAKLPYVVKAYDQ